MKTNNLKTQFSQTQLLCTKFKEQALEPSPLDYLVHVEEIRVIRNEDKDLGHGLKAFFQWQPNNGLYNFRISSVTLNV
jgi:hypothetical protein